MLGSRRLGYQFLKHESDEELELRSIVVNHYGCYLVTYQCYIYTRIMGGSAACNNFAINIQYES